MKMIRVPRLILLSTLLLAGCAARSGDTLKDVGNVGIGLADGIHGLQTGVAALSPSPIPAVPARDIQSALLKANDELGRLPDFLEAADAARKVGQVDPGQIEETIRVIGSISDQLNIVIRGLDVGDAASKMLKLAAETRLTASKITTGLAGLRAELAKE